MMEPDMERLPKDNAHIIFCGRAAFAALILLFVFFSGELPAFSDEKNTVLEKSGIIYPGGYDQNTVGEIHGKVQKVYIPESGPVRFSLVSGRETYMVIVSPRWYWEDFSVKISSGEDVNVIGSKTLGKDDNLYMIAQEIKVLSSGKTVYFRNNEGRPLWSAGGQGIGGNRGYGPHSGGFGGMGNGVGGMGRGRR